MTSFIGDRRVARLLHFVVEVSDYLPQRSNWMGLYSIWYSKGKAVDFPQHVGAGSFVFFTKVIPPYTNIEEKRLRLIFANLEGSQYFGEERLPYLEDTDYLVHRNAEMWCAVKYVLLK